MISALLLTGVALTGIHILEKSSLMNINWKQAILSFIVFAAIFFVLQVFLMGATVESALLGSVIAGIIFSVGTAIYRSRKGKQK